MSQTKLSAHPGDTARKNACATSLALQPGGLRHIAGTIRVLAGTACTFRLHNARPIDPLGGHSWCPRCQCPGGAVLPNGGALSGVGSSSLYMPHFFERRYETAAAIKNPMPSERRMPPGKTRFGSFHSSARKPSPRIESTTPTVIVVRTRFLELCLSSPSASRSLLLPSLPKNSANSRPESNLSKSFF